MRKLHLLQFIRRYGDVYVNGLSLEWILGDGAKSLQVGHV